MSKFDKMAKDFLEQEHIAVAGVSRSEDSTANFIYRTLRDKGYSVYAVNPNAEEVEGDPCFSNMQSIPRKVDGVVIVTKPEISEQVVEDCVKAKVPRVWMHNSTFMGGSSVSDKATAVCHENGIFVIDGGCPLMFMDFGHRCMKWVLGVTGRLPNG
jgi:predicted CoA-binding protein